MTTETYDIVVLGSGFGGSLLSAVLAKSGLKVAIVDRTKHPRFAIGESSTPLADATLAQLAREFDLPELLPLTEYGSWKSVHPEISCGLKRGFSYFGHHAGTEFHADNQLLIAASDSDEHSDTHWLRSDVDTFFFRLAQQSGVTEFEEATCSLKPLRDGWQIEGTCQDAALLLKAPFVVDATGSAGAVLRTLDIPGQTNVLKTNSRAVFAHFLNACPVAELLDDLGICRQSHPFPCDAAAVHHVLDDGWMWQLRFDDGSVSAGFVFDQLGNSAGAGSSDPDHEWNEQLKRFPFLQRQFADATVIRPTGGLQQTGRLQRLTSVAACANWAALPATAGFIDPLHSTGIAHSLFGVRRLARILTATASADQRRQQLQNYSAKVIDELRLVDELVEGCYAALPDFRLWGHWCMLYFAAVTSMEQATGGGNDPSFLRADDREFRAMLTAARLQLQSAIDGGSAEAACHAFEDWLREAIQPWNNVGLLNPDCGGMYRQTAAPVRSHRWSGSA